MKAIKKPVEIDFFVWENNIDDLKEWVTSFNQNFEEKFIVSSTDVKVKTLEGTSYDLVQGIHIIVRGVRGEYYPCDKEIFLETYDVL